MKEIPLLFSLLQTAQGRDTVALYKKRLRSQWLSRKNIKEIQFRQLKALLNRAEKHVPYFKKNFQEHRIGGSQITSFEDFAQTIPIMDKEILRSNLPHFHADNADSKLIIHRTGGSSGQPLEFPRDRMSVSSYWADYLLSRSWWGITIGEPYAKIWGHFHEPQSVVQGITSQAKNFIKQKVMNEYFLSAYQMSDSNMESFAHLLRQKKPYSLYGYASALETFAHFINKTRFDLELPGSAVVIATSEPLTEEQRELFKSTYRCAVANEYGTCESGLIAFECPAQSLHLLEESSYVEFIDKNGNTVDEGIGEILVTSLCNYSVPLIRYRLGDMINISQNRCSCGRESIIIKKIEGRKWSMLQGINDKIVYPQLITQIVMQYSPNTKRFQAIQTHSDRILLKLELSKELDKENKRKLEESLIKRLGVGMVINIESVEKIVPEKSGKYIPVKSLLN